MISFLHRHWNPKTRTALPCEGGVRGGGRRVSNHLQRRRPWSIAPTPALPSPRILLFASHHVNTSTQHSPQPAHSIRHNS